MSDQLTASNDIGRCTRCGTEKTHIWSLSRTPNPSFGDFDLAVAPIIRCEDVCRECLTDKEIAELLSPVIVFWLTARLMATPSGSSSVIGHSLAMIRAQIEFESGCASLPNVRAIALRALEGLKGIPPPDIDYHALHSDLEKVLARNMYLVAHPDEVPTSAEGLPSLETKVRIFFRDGGSIAMHCLRDSVYKCVDIFKRRFARSAYDAVRTPPIPRTSPHTLDEALEADKTE